jgi:hypothetical protein
MRCCQFLCAAIFLVALAATMAEAQRSRTVATPQPTPAPDAQPTTPAPASVTAKYEGGVTGYMKKQTGSLFFDDASRRLVFKDKYQREYVSVPYKSLAAIWADTKAVTSNAAKVVSAVPLYGIGLTSLLMPKNKQRFLVVQFDDPDTRLSGTTSFKLANKELVASVLNTLAQKADLKPRGEAFIRSTPNAKP